MKKKLSLFLAFAVVLGSFAGTFTKEDTANAAKKKVLNLPISDEIPSMDSTKATDSVSFGIMNNVMEGLYRLDKSNNPVPGMAKSYKKSADGKTWTFTLRDAKWSNGDKVTANDFVYAWRKLQDPKTAAEYAYIMHNVVLNATEVNSKKKPVTALGVRAVNATTLEVKLANPVPYFLSLTTFPAFYPQNEKYVKAQSGKYALEADKLVYNGPFTMTSWKHNTSVQLQKNKKYWDAATVKLDEINFSVVKETSTGVNLYETGKLDRVGLNAEYVDKYKKKKEYKTRADASVFFLRLNQEKAELKNLNLRKAITSAIDKKAFTDTILNNGSQPADYLVPKNFVNGPAGTKYAGKDFRTSNGKLTSYNAKQAKSYWAKAQKELGKKSITIELLNYDGESARKLGEYFKNQLELNLPGLKIKIKQQPFKQKLDLEQKGEYDLSFAGWGPDFQDPMTFLDMFVTDGDHNQMKYSNKQYDKLIADAKKGGNLTTRWEALLKAEQILIKQDAAILPLYQRGAAYVEKSKVSGVIAHSFGPDFSYKWASVK